MKINRRILGMVFVLIGALTGSARAGLDFYFTIPVGDGVTVPISGEIFGLTDNAASAPTDIVITSDPFNTHITTPYSLFSNGYIPNSNLTGPPTNSPINTFTVSGGEIVDANLEWYTDTSPYTPSQNQFYAFNGFGSSGERDDFYGTYNINNAGFVASYFTPASSVPEPSQWGFALFMVAASCLFGRRYFVRRVDVR